MKLAVKLCNQQLIPHARSHLQFVTPSYVVGFPVFLIIANSSSELMADSTITFCVSRLTSNFATLSVKYKTTLSCYNKKVTN